jgi:flagellar FliJ protein
METGVKRSKRMQRVSDLGEQEVQRAGQKLASARQAQGSARQLLEQLQDYRREYQQLFERQRAQGMDPLRYGNFQRFFDQLDRAIDEQRRVLDSSDQQVQQQQSVWLEKRQHTEILSRLTGRIAAEEYREEQRQEQKQSDERSSQRHNQS